MKMKQELQILNHQQHVVSCWDPCRALAQNKVDRVSWRWPGLVRWDTVRLGEHCSPSLTVQGPRLNYVCLSVASCTAYSLRCSLYRIKVITLQKAWIRMIHVVQVIHQTKKWHFLTLFICIWFCQFSSFRELLTSLCVCCIWLCT